MCMKNVNATLLMCSSVATDSTASVSFNGIFDCVIPTRDVDVYYIDNMSIILNCSTIFDESFIGRDDCLQLDTEYEFMIRLTHVESGYGAPLFSFTHTIQKEQLHTWCKDFYEFKRIVNLPRIRLDRGLGNYALKLRIRPKSVDNTAGWKTQTLHRLTVGDSRTS